MLDKAKETVENASTAVSGAMRVAVISCVLSVLAILIALAALIAGRMPPLVSRET
jgi:hypothetical protein